MSCIAPSVGGRIKMARLLQAPAVFAEMGIVSVACLADLGKITITKEKCILKKKIMAAHGLDKVQDRPCPCPSYSF